MTRRYHPTATAKVHLKEAIRETRLRWGRQQSQKYKIDFERGLQHLAENHPRLGTHHRAAMAEGTDFQLHLIGQRYVAFQPYGKNDILIAGIFHEAMDMPRHLTALQHMTHNEIALLKREIRTVLAHQRKLH